MTPEQTKSQLDLATSSAKAQRELNQSVLDSQLDAADRIIMRKAADAVINTAELVAKDPT